MVLLPHKQTFVNGGYWLVKTWKKTFIWETVNRISCRINMSLVVPVYQDSMWPEYCQSLRGCTNVLGDVGKLPYILVGTLASCSMNPQCLPRDVKQGPGQFRTADLIDLRQLLEGWFFAPVGKLGWLFVPLLGWSFIHVKMIIQRNHHSSKFERSLDEAWHQHQQAHL